MPQWFIKICDPDGHRERDQCYGNFSSTDAAYIWAKDNIPNHITWHCHHINNLDMFNRKEWEERLPDFLSTIPHKRSSF